MPQPKCQAYLATFLPAADGKAQAHEHPGVEMIYVVAGELAISVEDTEHVLAAGDAMYFEASVPHSYRRKGRHACSALVFTVPQ